MFQKPEFVARLQLPPSRSTGMRTFSNILLAISVLMIVLAVLNAVLVDNPRGWQVFLVMAAMYGVAGLAFRLFISPREEVPQFHSQT